jgi:hypothetical protein
MGAIRQTEAIPAKIIQTVEGKAMEPQTKGFWDDCDWVLCHDEKWRPVEPGTSPLIYDDGSPVEFERIQGRDAHMIPANDRSMWPTPLAHDAKGYSGGFQKGRDLPGVAGNSYRSSSELFGSITPPRTLSGLDSYRHTGAADSRF